MSDAPTPDTSDAGTESSFNPITTQADLDRIIGERVARERNKFADYADLKTKADAFDAAEQANLSALEKMTKRAEKAENETAQLKFNAIKFEVAGEKSVPANLLSGTTREELEASADALVAFAGEQGKPRTPLPDPSQGRNQPPLNGSALEDMLRAKLNF